MSVAVQTPNGLMVPVVRDADILGLAEISATVKELAAKVGLSACGPLWYIARRACSMPGIQAYRLQIAGDTPTDENWYVSTTVASAVVCSTNPYGWIVFMQ